MNELTTPDNYSCSILYKALIDYWRTFLVLYDNIYNAILYNRIIYFVSKIVLHTNNYTLQAAVFSVEVRWVTAGKEQQPSIKTDF